ATLPTRRSSDLTPLPTSPDLGRWAKQGVLLLNATLTVRKGEAGSHQGKGWETFTDAVIKTVSDQKESVVFLLWGAYAQKKESLIDNSKHLVRSEERRVGKECRSGWVRGR